jgi:hypothetical protein
MAPSTSNQHLSQSPPVPVPTTAHNNNDPRPRLLMPTVRPPRHPQPPYTFPSPAQPPPRSPRLKPTTNILIRSRSGSASHVASDVNLSTTNTSPALSFAAIGGPNGGAGGGGEVGMEWLGKPCRFEFVQESLQIEGYQMYAVEKWCVPLPLLCHYIEFNG